MLLQLLFITVPTGNTRSCYEKLVKPINKFRGKMQSSFLGKVFGTVPARSTVQCSVKKG